MSTHAGGVPEPYGRPGSPPPERPAVPVRERVNYLTVSYGIKSWLLTVDHKRIALLYMFSISIMFAIGGIFATLIRLELITPPGDMVQSETYNKLFTMHGVVMVFFFLIPSIPATLGNFLIPIMIGAKDLAFPRLNLLSWYIYMAGAAFTMYAMIAGGVDTGWTFYVPYSTHYSNTHVIATGLCIFITGFSSILTGLNFIVTIHKMRAPGAHRDGRKRTVRSMSSGLMFPKIPQARTRSAGVAPTYASELPASPSATSRPSPAAAIASRARSTLVCSSSTSRPVRSPARTCPSAAPMMSAPWPAHRLTTLIGPSGSSSMARRVMRITTWSRRCSDEPGRS